MRILFICALTALAASAGAQERYVFPAAQIVAVVQQVDVDSAAKQVSAALRSAENLPANDISVTTHAHTVVLTGVVDNEAQRDAALAVAEKAAAGVRISANLEVRPLQDRPPQEQAAIAQASQLVREVEAALKADARTANLGVTVSAATADVVVLQGLVPSREHRTTVQIVVSKVSGVKQVENRLLVP